MEDSTNNSKHSSSIPVIEEKLEIEKKVVEKGRVKISKTVKEESEILNLPQTSEEVRIERIPINKVVEKAPEAVRYEGETMVISVLEEIAVVEKKILVVEEIRVTKTSVRSETKQEVSLRKEEIKVERSDTDF